MSTTKEKYKDFIEYNYVPIFYRDWYLDAVCDSPWDVVICEEDGEVVGTLVFMIKKKYGLTYILHPSICPYMGPLFFGSLDVSDVYSKLLDQLPQHHLMIQDYFHSIPSIGNHQQLSRKKYTYLISEGEDIDVLKSSMKPDRRRRIRKAGEIFTYETVNEFSEFSEFLDQSFASRAKNNPYKKSSLANLDQKLKEHNGRKIIKATDKSGKVMAMEYLLLDEKWVYNLANGVRQDYRHDALSYILWTEIEDALSKNKSFDFEGSVIPGIEQFFKSLRGVKTNYQCIYKSKNAFIDTLVRFKNPDLQS